MFELSRIPAPSRVAATDSDPARDLRPGAARVPVHGGSHVSGLHHPPQCTRLDPPLCSFMKKNVLYNVHILIEHWKIKCQFFIKILDKRFNLGIKIKHKKNTTMKHCILSVSICLNQYDLIVIILSYPLMRQIDSLRLSYSYTFPFTRHWTGNSLSCDVLTFDPPLYQLHRVHPHDWGPDGHVRPQHPTLAGGVPHLLSGPPFWTLKGKRHSTEVKGQGHINIVQKSS